MQLALIFRRVDRVCLALPRRRKRVMPSRTDLDLLVRFAARGVVHGLVEGGGSGEGDERSLGLSLTPDCIIIDIVVVIMTVKQILRSQSHALVATSGQVCQHPRLFHICLRQIFWKLIEGYETAAAWIIIYF